MRKHFYGFMTMLFAAGFCLVSCSKELPVVEEEPVGSYVINIPVQMTSTKAVAEGDGKATATFKTTDNVYIYNKTKKTWDSAVLHPAEADVSETLLTGTLNGTNYAVGDDITVLYRTDSQGVVDYSAQDGTLDHVVDAGTADVQIKSIEGGNILTGGADIQNLQSIFRFVFKAGNTELNGIRFVRIFSSDNKLQTQYNVISGATTYGPITISSSDDLEDSNHHIYAGLRFTANPGDLIVFQVVTSDGKVYSGSKTAPADGFVDGKFYTSTVNVNLYTFTVASGKKVCFSPGDLGKAGDVYSFTTPFADWGSDAKKNNYTGNRSWFDYREIDEDSDPATSIYGITWRIETKVSNAYEWDYILSTRTMENGVKRYYKLTVNGHPNCLLLPPDESTAADIGSDIANGSVGTDYVKYLAKGFVLLMNARRGTTNTSTTGTISWSSTYFSYWCVFENGTNRKHLYWSSSIDPKVTWPTNQLRMHVRLVHDVPVSTE